MTAVMWWKLTWQEPQAVMGVSIFPSILSYGGGLQHTRELQHLAASLTCQMVGTFSQIVNWSYWSSPKGSLLAKASDVDSGYRTNWLDKTGQNADDQSYMHVNKGRASKESVELYVAHTTAIKVKT
ncbi:hypothetical protein N7449_001717 [Penicillium cf. viridicatum]|uniref:Uncharacterized protein n=1 Tax=Penicillium cf. viridicatum TaxID=2972119 RepID=A0A9W9T9I9_9EURO|nr:hypothetical protein N7449_001717 [Penicillium cf. viridicatum]